MSIYKKALWLLVLVLIIGLSYVGGLIYFIFWILSKGIKLNFLGLFSRKGFSDLIKNLYYASLIALLFDFIGIAGLNLESGEKLVFLGIIFFGRFLVKE